MKGCGRHRGASPGSTPRPPSHPRRRGPGGPVGAPSHRRSALGWRLPDHAAPPPAPPPQVPQPTQGGGLKPPSLRNPQSRTHMTPHRLRGGAPFGAGVGSHVRGARWWGTDFILPIISPPASSVFSHVSPESRTPPPGWPPSVSVGGGAVGPGAAERLACHRPPGGHRNDRPQLLRPSDPQRLGENPERQDPPPPPRPVGSQTPYRSPTHRCGAGEGSEVWVKGY